MAAKNERVIKQVRMLRRQAKQRFYQGRARTARRMCRRAKMLLRKAGLA